MRSQKLDWVNIWLRDTATTQRYQGKIIRTTCPPFRCKDGFTVSIQAGESLYSEPREWNAEKYESVELGYPSEADSLISEWAEDPDDPAGGTDTVYGWVPIEVVNKLIDKHGGLDEEEYFVKKLGGKIYEIAGKIEIGNDET